MLKIRNNKKVIKRMRSFVKPYSIFVFISFVCASISVAGQLLVPILSGNAIDCMIDKGKVDFEVIMNLLISIGVITAICAIAQWALAICNNKISFCVSKDLRNASIEKIQKLPLAYLDKHPTGDLVSRIVADVDTVSEGLLMGLTQLFSGVLAIIATIVFMLWLNPIIALIVILLTPLSLFMASFIAKRTHRYFKEQTNVRGEQTAYVNEMIEGMKVVKAFAYEDKNIEKFDEINKRYENISLKAVFFSSLTNPSTRFVNNIVYAAVGLTGALYTIMGGITVGQLTVFLKYANQYAKPFNEISGVITELQNAIVCADRILQLLEEENQVSEKNNACELISDGNVKVDNISFSYNKERELIKNFNLSVKSGERIAIVGPTGCGKTTIINLLMRFYDVDNGTISIAGEDIRDVTRNSLRKNFGMVLQETWLKEGTIRENIAYGKIDATDEEIIRASKSAYAHSFIKRLPDGYNTIITENGGNLSQGQKQLLCIARVMLCLPPMLILDEATSSIDTRTEMKIQSAFSKMMKGRTSFIVAHRLSTIREADTILVMNNGNIVEQGNHDELLKLGGYYSRLYNVQYER